MKKLASELLIKSIYLPKNASQKYFDCCKDILDGKLPNKDIMNHYHVGEDVLKFAGMLNKYSNKEYAYEDKNYRYMPIYTKELAKKSDDYFSKNYKKFDDKVSIAKKIYNKLGKEASVVVKACLGKLDEECFR